MRLRCASAAQFFDGVTDDRAVRGSNPNSHFSWLFVFLLILNLIFYSTVTGLTKFKTRRSLSD